MNNEEKDMKNAYIAPEMLCVPIVTETAVLTASGDIDGIPWED